MFEVTEQPGVPIYQRIADAVCEAIRSGKVATGDQLPTKVALAEDLGISRLTVSQSYDLLQRQGIVAMKRGSGTYVLPGALDRVRDADAPRFDSITVVLGRPSLDAWPRDVIQILVGIFSGIDDVLAERAGRYRYVEALDRETFTTLTPHDAVLLWRPEHAGLALLHELHQQNIPVITIWRDDTPTDIPAVYYDPHQAAHLACQHLLACGYRRLGFIGEMGRDAPLAAKFFGFTNVLYRHGLDFQVRHVREVGYQQPGAAFEAAQDIIQSGDPPDAFFAATDYMAMEVIRAVRKAGLNVPTDIGVVGYSDSPEAAMFDPPLTTVRTPRREIGQTVARMLCQWDKHEAPIPSVKLDSELVIRESTAKVSVPRDMAANRPDPTT